jgi:SAM-dependent methyltransferase
MLAIDCLFTYPIPLHPQLSVFDHPKFTMSLPNITTRFWEVFFQVYEPLPRQGPGNRPSAERAFRQCEKLPGKPAILDMGCGSGGQTLHLAELSPGSITALDNHAPSISRLQSILLERGLEHRIQAIVADMACPDLPTGSFDLIWSEGALYSVGLETSLSVCHRLLRSGGYLVFTDAVWRLPNPPAKVKTSFDLDYPGMGTVEDDLALLLSCGFSVLDHFTLPDEAWWDDFYTPMESRIHELLGQYATDAEALTILGQLSEEPAMHREFGHYYAYEYFIARRND